MSNILHQRPLQNPFSHSTNSKKPISLSTPTSLLTLLLLVIVMGILCPWVGLMPQNMVFSVSKPSHFSSSKWSHYTLDQALGFVAKNGTVIVCILRIMLHCMRWICIFCHRLHSLESDYSSRTRHGLRKLKECNVIIHNNYIVGFEKKVKRFRDHGLWLVDDHAEESPLGRLRLSAD